MRKRKDLDPYLGLMDPDPDPGGPKICICCGSEFPAPLGPMYFVFCGLYPYSPPATTAVFGSFLSSIYSY